MASWHLIPKAPRASLILLTGSVVISRPSYPVACRLRGISGIDPAAGEVPREASTSDIILVAVVATRHMSRCPLKASSVCTRTGGLAALPGDLEDLLDAVAGVAGGQPPLSHPPSASGHERRSRPAARRGRSGHGQARPREAPALLALADLPAGEASAEPVVHGRGRDLSDTGPTTEGPVVDTLLPDGADKTR